MNESDIAELVGYFLGAFGLGFCSGYLLRFFHRVAGLISR